MSGQLRGRSIWDIHMIASNEKNHIGSQYGDSDIQEKYILPGSSDEHLHGSESGTSGGQKNRRKRGENLICKKHGKSAVSGFMALLARSNLAAARSGLSGAAMIHGFSSERAVMALTSPLSGVSSENSRHMTSREVQNYCVVSRDSPLSHLQSVSETLHAGGEQRGDVTKYE
jgi:hypothetical protein